MTVWLACAALCGSLGLAVQSPAETPTPAAVARPLSAKAEQALRARVLDWWAARERRDHQQMYVLFEPAYRKQVTFADFVRESAVRTRFDMADPRVVSVELEAADRARVKVDMETRPPGLPRWRVTAEEVWVLVSGKWFKVHQDPVSPFAIPR